MCRSALNGLKELGDPRGFNDDYNDIFGNAHLVTTLADPRGQSVRVPIPGRNQEALILAQAQRVNIDTAIAADIPALSELLAVLFAQEAEFTPDSTAHAKGLARIIGNPDAGTILVARENEQVIGLVNLLFTISTACGARVALLEDMFVTAANRRMGIGSRLLAHAISLANKHDCKRITLLTDPMNETAQQFYAKHGFRASSMIPMRLSLR